MPAPKDINILPGMNARVFFQDPSQENESSLVNVPVTSITTQGDDLFVWVLNDESMTVTKRKIIVKDGENIERALKRYKRKHRNIKVMQNLREGQFFTKPSVKRRREIQKAEYIQNLRDQEEV